MHIIIIFAFLTGTLRPIYRRALNTSALYFLSAICYMSRDNRIENYFQERFIFHINILNAKLFAWMFSMQNFSHECFQCKIPHMNVSNAEFIASYRRKFFISFIHSSSVLTAMFIIAFIAQFTSRFITWKNNLFGKSPTFLK